MKKSPEAERPVDHFLQAQIVSMLTAAERPLRFSELKEEGVENSLFMYHVNKLIRRGLVQKDDAGFSLTLKGARWANYTADFNNSLLLTPRPLVQFVIQDPHDNILLAVRKGQLRHQLNDYLLPGNIYRHGLDLQDNVALILAELFGEHHNLSSTHLTTADVINTYDDDFVNHVISNIFRVRVPTIRPQPLEHPLFTTDWVLKDTITVADHRYHKSLFLPLLFERLSSLKTHETFAIQSK